MRKFKVWLKRSEEASAEATEIDALNAIDAENRAAAKFNVPHSWVSMSKDLQTGRLHTP